jgi:hypothetical protein
MDVQTMIGFARSRCGDNNDPQRTSDDEWMAFANAAENEACRRARLLVDASTATVATYTVTAGNPLVSLHASVLYPRRVMWAGRTQPLQPLDLRDMDELRPGWESDTASQPEGYIRNYATGKLRLYPSPTANGTLNCVVVRIPLAEMDAMDDSPELHARLHEALIDGMLERHYNKADADVYDAKRAEFHGARFTAEFGPPVSSLDEQWQMEQYGYNPDTGGFR